MGIHSSAAGMGVFALREEEEGHGVWKESSQSFSLGREGVERGGGGGDEPAITPGNGE